MGFDREKNLMKEITEHRGRRGLDRHERELSDEDIVRVCGGTVISPRDPASGLPTGQRMHNHS